MVFQLTEFLFLPWIPFWGGRASQQFSNGVLLRVAPFGFGARSALLYTKLATIVQHSVLRSTQWKSLFWRHSDFLRLLTMKNLRWKTCWNSETILNEICGKKSHKDEPWRGYQKTESLILMHPMRIPKWVFLTEFLVI